MKKNRKEIVIYDGYDISTYEDAEIDYYNSMGYESKENFLKENGCSELLEYTTNMYEVDIETNWNCFDSELEELLMKNSENGWLIVGICERWDGKYKGGNVIFDKKELYKVIYGNSIDTIKVWDENGHLYIKSYHHDGTNCFELKRLTKKGHDFWKKWEEGECGEGDLLDITEEECHQKLFNSNFMSGLAHFVKTIY
jgi:hypothetical protein